MATREMNDPLTPVDEFGDWFAKREDLAAYERPDWPSGAKVRQYLKMCVAQPGAPVLVGCSAFSAMQIYVAAAAEKFGVPGIVYVPGRATESDATRYARAKGVEVCSVRPCPGPNVYKARARDRAKRLGRYVKWDFVGALHDAKHQARNVPDEAKRVLVPTGSGLIVAGVLAGLVGRNDVTVVAVAGSTMADGATILANAAKVADGKPLPPFELIRAPEKYERAVVERLPDGTPLDPFYAAKLLRFRRPGDCLWLTGLRPVCSMPADCQKAFRGWEPR